ncbi:hypothetical protein GOP47_0029788 [Adiantum capillus-veneris]|nr:hypothetical protein GOP47_0029788 [Adiantum capillus-veneris]
MTVKWLLYWQPGSASQVPGNILQEVMKSIESLNATRGSRWEAKAAQYRPILRDAAISVDCARDILGVFFSDNPTKYFFILRAEHMVVEADSNIQEIMEKLQTYRNRLTLVFEGYHFQLGDFNLKAGRAVLNGESIRGIFLEVEYLPVSSIEKSRMLLQEFVDLWQDVLTKQSLNGKITNLEASFGNYMLSDTYSWQHTAVQYITLMTHFLSQRN